MPDRDVEVTIPAPPASASYLDITVDVMQAFGAVSRTGIERFVVSTKSDTGKDVCDRRGLFLGIVLLCHRGDLRRQGDGGKPRAGLRAGRPEVP